MNAGNNVVQLQPARRARGSRRRDPDEPVYVFVLSTTRNRRLMRGIADHMLRQSDPDVFLASHLRIERGRLMILEMPLDQIELELAAVARTARALVWKIREAQA